MVEGKHLLGNVSLSKQVVCCMAHVGMGQVYHLLNFQNQNNTSGIDRVS